MSENKFNNIFQIDPKIHETWKNKIFLTFDIDWAHDEVILDLLELISKYQVNTTWFVTHYTNLLRILEAEDRKSVV
jgi:peptidoglycan/xylan/chitin deacetylase (PgdA/CDA1 family)